MNEPFNDWALALANYFFGPHMAGKRTRLSITEGFLNEEFGYLGGYAGFIAAVKTGPIWAITFQDTGLHDMAMATYKMWRSNIRPKSYPDLPNDAPPFIPFLAVLCLAWTIEDEVVQLAGNTFYGRLELVLPGHGLDTTHLAKWLSLWEGLQEWSEAQQGNRGIWKIERLGLAHVGIPCSQVMLTPCKVRRLPELFHFTGISMLAQHGTPAPEEIVVSLRKAESYTRNILGNSRADRIFKGLEIGKEIIKLLCEHLANLENLTYEPEKAQFVRDHSKEGLISHADMRFVLEWLAGSKRWAVRFGLVGEAPSAPTYISNEWSFRKKGIKDGGFWVAESDGKAIDACEFCDDGSISFTHEFRCEGDDGESTLLLKTQKRGIRIFKNWVSKNHLSEDFSLPRAGGCYLLAVANRKEELALWVVKFTSQGGRTLEVPQKGLPSNSILYYIDNISVVNREIIDSFPERSASRARTSYISLIGGSRIQTTGAERIYLSYDLPTVQLECSDGLKLEAKGVQLDPQSNDAIAPESMPGQTVKQYELLPEKGSMTITLYIKDRSSDQLYETISFGVNDHQLLSESSEWKANIRFDKFGQVTQEPGVIGALFDDSLVASLLPTTPASVIAEELMQGLHSVAAIPNDPRFDMLEALRQKRRLTGKEFKRRAEKITGDWKDYSWADLRWLRALGHVEVERDMKGRIAYVYPLKPHVYFLPWSFMGNCIGCVAGCPTRAELEHLAESSAILECKIYLADRGSGIIPPAVFISGPAEDVQICIKDAGFQSPESMTEGNAEQFAFWAGTLQERLDCLTWQPGNVAQQPEAIFEPYRFRMLPPNEFNCPYKLFRTADSFSPQNKWHVLNFTGSLSDQDTRHVFLQDSSWGKWQSIFKATEGIPERPDCPDDEYIPLPYSQQNLELFVPASARFPSILSRALLMCSGLPPRQVPCLPYFTNRGSLFLTDCDVPYVGTCYVYRFVPVRIAQLVCEKVCAWPVDTSTIEIAP